MRDFLNIAKALSDSNRLRILCAMRERELCVCQIIELLGLAPSTVSKHLSILYQARFVESRKQGRWMYYRLPRPGEVPIEVSEALTWTHRVLASEQQIREDEARLTAILARPPEDLCQEQATRLKSCSSAPATPAAARWPRDGQDI